MPHLAELVAQAKAAIEGHRMLLRWIRFVLNTRGKRSFNAPDVHAARFAR